MHPDWAADRDRITTGDLETEVKLVFPWIDRRQLDLERTELGLSAVWARILESDLDRASCVNHPEECPHARKKSRPAARESERDTDGLLNAQAVGFPHHRKSFAPANRHARPNVRNRFLESRG